MRLTSKIVLGLGLIVTLGSAQAQSGPGGGGGPGGWGGGGPGGWGGGSGGGPGGGWPRQWQCIQNVRTQQGFQTTFTVYVQARHREEAIFRGGAMLTEQERYSRAFPMSHVMCRSWGK